MNILKMIVMKEIILKRTWIILTKHIALDQIQENFVFVVGGQEYKCLYGVAEFLSARVCLSHSVDPWIVEYVVETPGSQGRFKSFMSLGSGSTISIPKANLDFFLSLSRELGSSNLDISLVEHFYSHLIGLQIPDLTTLALFADDHIGRISSTFSELGRSELDAIPVSVLFHILSHHLLIISSEADLFSYIGSRICSDPEYLDLLQFVHFEYVSSECVCCFISAAPDSTDRRLWESISRRWILPVPHAVEFPLKEAESSEGIISYLTRKYGGNVHDKGIVTITSK
jgi:hypothetical protein